MDLSHITTREEAHEVFGKPAATGHLGEEPFDEFFTYRKIADQDERIFLGTGDWLPKQLYVAARRSIRGQQLRFVYDAQGRVIDKYDRENWHSSQKIAPKPSYDP